MRIYVCRRCLFCFLFIIFNLCLAGTASASAFGDGEFAFPRYVKEPQDPPPSVIWGPFPVPDLRGLQWGLYGMAYNPLKSRLDAVYFWQGNVRRYRSVDSTNPALPETIRTDLISSPVGDSFQDFSYSRYDNAIWIHSSKYKKVYKINADNGTLLREFSSPARQYPIGIAFNEREKRLYLIDRMYEGTFPCSLYVTDTLGNVIARWGLSHLGYSYAGARCLDLDWTNSNPNWPTLLLLYSYFSGSGILDSCALFQLDRLTGSIISRTRLPNLAGQINNARGVAWDPRSGDYWISIMQSPDNQLYKMDGWHTPLSVDVGIVSLVAPLGEDSLNRVITPKVLIRNFGNQVATFPVTMLIGTTYNETRNKTLLPGQEDTVLFPNWIASPPGRVYVRCTTALSGDMFAPNNSWSDSFRVLAPPVIHDVGVVMITSPPTAIDSGTAVTPACTVYNFGNQTENYNVRMKIGDFYNEVVPVLSHAPQTKVFLTFPNWDAVQRGNWIVSCSTELASDINPANDRQTGSVLVRVRDVGVLIITSPPREVDSGSIITPACTVYNYGNASENYVVRFKIGDFYNETAPVSSHPPQGKVYLTFPVWQVHETGTWTVKCSTELAGDMYPENDLKTCTTTVGVVDAGVARIIAPSGFIDSGSVVTPQVLVKNFGNIPITLPVWMRISPSAYEDSTWLSLAPRDSSLVEFAPWQALSSDTFTVISFTALSGDRNPTNDTGLTWVIVRPPQHDVGVVQIVSPTGEIDSGTVVIPKAIIQNLGTTPETFPVRFTIGDFYIDDTTIALGIGAWDTFSFRPWIASPLGIHIVQCTTRLTGDQNPANDRARDSVRIIPFSGFGEKFIARAPLGIFLISPNPFSNKTTIHYNLPQGSFVSIKIYNSSGQIVKSLVAEKKEKGKQIVVWDGSDEKGIKLPKGIYFCQLNTPDHKERKKVLKL